MKMRRKLIKITAAAGMAVVLLAGCGSGGNYTPSNAGSSDGQTDGSATSNKEEELQAEIDALQQEIDDLKNAQGQQSTAENAQDDSAGAENSQSQTDMGNAQSSSETQASGTGRISVEEAKQIALERVPGATDQDISIELDEDDGWYIYEGDILYNRIEYEFEIDAETGSILKWEQERW